MTDAALPAPMPWTCPRCAVKVHTPFCATCGEHPLKPNELTLRGLVHLVFEAFSNIDSRLLRSLRYVIAKPGELTKAFMTGVRKPYIGAIPLFLLANVLFFAMQSFTKMKIFSSDLAFRLKGQLWSDFSQELVDQRLAATARSFAEYAPVFDQAIAVNAKSLIGLMVIPFALIPLLVFWKRRPLAVHVIFSLHFYAFFLLLLCAVLGCVVIDRILFGGDGSISQRSDDIVSIFLLTSCALYVWAAIGPVYGTTGWPRIAQAFVLIVAAMWIFFGYRFALLPITLYTT